MYKKLTLRLDNDIIEQAKRYATENNESLSKMVEKYFKMMVNNKEPDKKYNISSEIKSLSGVIDLPENFEIKQEYNDYRDRKYGL